ncbi:MAG: DUF1385 domain-containing protein [Candidatus Krumholzibacteriota bacterium]|nr:DUF1385 domain-containing protein [Candidatus Krumholzibacteriota bacterium]
MTDEDERRCLQVGGQAVIEGVMMRSPSAIATAVRCPDGQIAIKTESFLSLTKRHKLWNLPVIRGAIVLVETFIIALKALTFSVEKAEPDEDKKEKKGISAASMVFTMGAALGLGFLVFFYLPLKLTELLKFENGFYFNLVDGFIRLLFIFLYVFIITRWKEMRRVFQYHGAEHKTIFAYEDGGQVTPQKARAYSRLHPRCSTSFLLIVVMVSVFVFILLGKPESIPDRLLRFSFILPIAGISYEVLKLSARPAVNRRLGFMFWPGLLMQRLTTGEPEDDQLEVAIAALHACLDDKLLETERVIH